MNKRDYLRYQIAVVQCTVLLLLKSFLSSRKTEEEAGDAGLEVSVLKKKVSSLEEESSQLKKSLTHVQGELDQQQRLNHALAQRNVRKLIAFGPFRLLKAKPL